MESEKKKSIIQYEVITEENQHNQIGSDEEDKKDENDNPFEGDKLDY